MNRATAAFVGLCAACSRSIAPDTTEASTTSSATSSVTSEAPSPPTASAAPAPPIDPAPPGEAKRSTIASFDREPLLRSQVGKLREHFGASSVGPYEVQRLDLASARTAFLVSHVDESSPIVLVMDRDQLLFAKDRPTAGIAPPALHATIAPAPERGVAVFSYVESMHIVAARMWADDANPYAEIEVFRPEACDALSVAYEASAGWVAACSSRDGTRVERLRSDLTVAWDKQGVSVGTVGPVGRAALGFESPTVWTLEQSARAVGGDRKLSFRYGIDAKAQ